jgi:NADH-quinone oxidoreductase subunit J
MEHLIFYFFAAILVVSGTLVITVKNPVHAALFLVLAFFASAGVWLLLEAEFLAITLVLVYVGAVMVLFLFVVMMLDINLTPLREGFARFLPIGGAVAFLMITAMILAVGPRYFGADRVAAAVQHPAGYSNTRELGRLLYTDYLYPFEIAAVILLVAIVAAIVLTLRDKRQTKSQRPEEQVAVRRADRVRLVKMGSDERQ